MKKSKKIPKTLPKYKLGAKTRTLPNGNEVSDAGAGGTENIYNQNRGSKINAGQYAQAGTAIGMGTIQAFQGYNNPYANDLEKTRSVQAGADTAKIGVATAVNPLLGAGVGAVTKIGSGVQDNVDRTDANGNIINRNDSKMGEIAGGFLSPSNSLIGIYTDPNATTGQKVAGALTGGLSDMFTNRHRNQVESNAKANLNQNQFAGGGMNMQPNARIEKEENIVSPNGGFYQSNSGTHESGNDDALFVPNKSMIFSDRLKAPGSKKTFAQLNKINNTNKEDKILDSNKTSSMSKRTAELMKFVKNKNSETLFNEQEALKQAKVEAYAKKMGVTIGDNKFPNGGTMRSEQESKLNDYSSELYQNWMASRANLSGKRMGPDVQTPGINLINKFLADPRTAKLSDEQYMKISEGLLNGVHQLRKSGDSMKHEDFTDIPEQKYPMGGVKLPMYPYGGDLDANMLSYGGDDPRFYNYQGNKVVKPNLNALNKDKGVSSDIGLNNYNNLLTTRAQVRDSKVLPTTTLPKFEYLNDPTKGSYDEQFNNYKKLYLPGFKYGGKKLPKYEDGGESEDNPLGYKPTNKVDQMRMQQALWNSQNKPSSSSWLTPEMMQASSDALIEEGYTNPSSPVINTTPTANTYPIRRDKNGKLIFDTPTSSTSSVGTKRDQELYDEELARMNASGGRDSNKVDWKNTLGQVGNFAAQNAGNIYNLSRYNKPEVERYERAKATLLDPAAAIRNAMEHTRRAEYNVRGASGGNAGTYLSNRVALNAQNINMVDAIRQQYANANAGISNDFAQYNNKLAMQEVIANAMNRARTRSGKGEAIGSLGSNIANQMMDNKKTNMDQETLQLMMKYYDTPEFQRIMKEYKGKK